MKSKKYILSLLSVYLVYMTHGIQAIVLSQNLDQFAAQWGTDEAGVYAVIGYTGLAKFISVWICGELSDKIGRKIMIVLGAVMYVGFFGLLLGTSNLVVAGVAAFLAGLATSFFDGACYPVAQETWVSSPGTAVILIKGVISVSGLIYPMLVVGLRSSGNWKAGVLLPLVMSVIVLVVSLISSYCYDDERKRKKREGSAAESGQQGKLDDDAQRGLARFVRKPPAFVTVGCAIYGFIAMAAMYSGQQLLTRFGLTIVGMDDIGAASLTSLYTGGSLAAVIIWGVFMAKFRWRNLKVVLVDLIGAVVSYALVCLIHVGIVVQIAALGIGFFAAGGALQCGVTLMQEFHPGNKGRNLGIYYTFMGAASYALPVIQSTLTANSNEGDAILQSLLLNLGLTAVGAVFMLYLAFNYKKWFGVSVMSPRGPNE